MKQVIKTKFIWVFLLTVLFTLLVTKLINQIFTREVTLDSGFVHTTHVHLNVPAMLVLAVPIGFMSLLLIQLFMNKFSKQEPHEARNGFNWYSLYGIILGFITFAVLASTVSSRIYAHEFVGTTEEVLWTLFAAIFPFVAAISLTLFINWGMMRLTNTNSEIISEVKGNLHNERLKDKKTKEKVLKALQRGHASTVTGAVIYVRTTSIIFGSIKAIVGGFIFIVVKLAEFLSSGISSGRSGGGPVSTPNFMSSESDIRAKEKEAKRQAQYRARQDQKQADYSRKKFIDQFNYNAKYSDAEWQRYKRDQRKADEARKRANRM